MQQCAEKYLKAFLIFHGKEISKTHNLAELIKSCANVDKGFQSLFDLKVHELTDYGIDIRYPDDFYFPSKEEAEEAIKIAEKAKEFVMDKLRKKGFKK